MSVEAEFISESKVGTENFEPWFKPSFGFNRDFNYSSSKIQGSDNYGCILTHNCGFTFVSFANCYQFTLARKFLSEMVYEPVQMQLQNVEPQLSVPQLAPVYTFAIRTSRVCFV